MVEPLRHRQTKGAETDMPDLPPPRHFPTLPRTDFRRSVRFYRHRRKNSKLSVVSIIVANMMPSAVLASSRRVGSRVSCF